MAAIDLTAGPDISDAAQRLKALREAAKMAVAGVAGDMSAAETLFRELAGRLDQVRADIARAQAEAAADTAWIQQLRTQASEALDALSAAPDSGAGNMLQEYLLGICQALDEECGLLDRNKLKLAEYNLVALQSSQALQAAQAALESHRQELAKAAEAADCSPLSSIQAALQGVTGGFAVLQEVVGAVSSNTESLVKIEARLQSALNIVSGLTEVSNALHATSAARIAAVTKVTELWHAANLSVGKGLISMGMAANTARIAAIALNGALTLGLGAAIGIAIGWITKLVERHKETRKIAEESAARQREAFTNYARSVGQEASGTIAKFEALRQQYRELGDDLAAKKKFITENAEAFRMLGLKVSGVNDAENILINNSQAFVAAIRQRAQAAAAMEIASEKYKQAIIKAMEAENISLRASKGRYYAQGLSKDQQAQLSKVITEATGKKRVELGSQQAAKYHSTKEIEKMVEDAGLAAGLAYVNSIRQGILGEANRLTAEGDKAVSIKIAKDREADQLLQSAGIKSAGSGGGSASGAGGAGSAGGNSGGNGSRGTSAAADEKEEVNQRDSEQDQSSLDALLSDEERRINDILEKYAKLRDSVSKKIESSDISQEEGEKLLGAIDTSEQQEVLDVLLAGIKSYEQQRLEIQQTFADKRKSLYEEDGVTLKKGVTQENIDETNRQEQEATGKIDEAFAQREATYQAWLEKIADFTLEQLNQALDEAEKALKELESSGQGGGQQAAVARAQIAKLKQNINTKNAQESATSPGKRSLKEWEKLYKALQEVEKEFESIGKTVGGTAGEIIGTAGKIATSALNMVNGIVKLANWSIVATEMTAAGASKAVQQVEKASVILAVIGAVLQIATTIAGLFNSDEKKEKEIKALQGRIDQLQWELNNAEAQRIKKNTGLGAARIKELYQEAYAEVLKLHIETDGVHKAFKELFQGKGYKTEALEKSVDKIVTAYASLDYTANKAYGADKFKEAQERMRNMAEQQVLLQQQINAEQGKKKTDHDKIQEWERQIEELGAEMAEVLNELTETIIGGSAEEIANDLADAFFEAFAAGEDAAEAWGEKVDEIVAGVIKRMLITQVLEKPLGEVFDKYKKEWFGDGKFDPDTVIDNIKASAPALAEDLRGASKYLTTALEELPDDLLNFLIGDIGADAQSASERGFQAMSEDTGSELNGRFTAIQGDVHDIRELLRAQFGSAGSTGRKNITDDLLRFLNMGSMGAALPDTPALPAFPNPGSDDPRYAIAAIARNGEQQLSLLTAFGDIREVSEQQLGQSLNIRDIMIQLNGNVADIRTYTRVLPEMSDTLKSMNRKLEDL